MDSIPPTNETNTSTSGEPTSTGLSLEFKIAKITFYTLILLLSITGNVLVIFTIYVDKKMRASSHIFILHLAICDLLTPTISIPFDLAYEEFHYVWPFGAVMCKALWPCQTFFTTSSTLLLTSICIDRYRALVYPFKRRWRGKRLFGMVFSIFLFAAVVVVPYMLVLNISEAGGNADCVEKWPQPATAFKQSYTMTLFLFQYGIPLVVMIVLYSVALYSLFHSNKNCFSTEQTGSFTTTDTTKSTKRGKQEHPPKGQTLLERRREQHFKVTKMFIIVVIVFAISMFPNQVLWLWVDYGNFSNSAHFPVTAIVCRLFTYSNSVLNPFIYGLYSKEFRSGYIKAGKKFSGHSQDSYKLTSRSLIKPRRKGYAKSGKSRKALLNGKTADKTSEVDLIHHNRTITTDYDLQQGGKTCGTNSIPLHGNLPETKDTRTDGKGKQTQQNGGYACALQTRDVDDAVRRISDDEDVEESLDEARLIQEFDQLQESRC